MNVRRTHRPGLTLTESLVALFVMALGLLSLLTLFPLGALQIGQALKDDRCGQTALQADGYLRAYWQKNVVEPPHLEDTNILQAMENPGMGATPIGSSITGASSENPIKITSAGHGLTTGQVVMIHDVGGLTSANGERTVTVTDANTFTIADTSSVPVDGTGGPAYTTGGIWVLKLAGTEPSYPVLVDPLGINAPLNIASIANANKIPRKSFVPISNPTLAIKTCCMLDDLTFGANDQPEAGGWQARYNWSAVLQHRTNTLIHEAEVKILVFDQRQPLLPVPNPEVSADAATAPGATSITLTVPAGDADTIYVRKGGWVMDGTVQASPVIRNSNFYRISGVTDNGGGSYTLDLETPIKPNVNGSPDAAFTAKFYFFAGLAEVFERPQLKPRP